MIQVVFCLRRRPDLSLPQFLDHWRERHAPLVVAHAEALGIVRYVQLEVSSGRAPEALREVRGSPEGFDGVAELWFDGLDTLRSSTPSARRAGRELLEDERRFIDLPRSPIHVCTVRDVLSSAPTAEGIPGRPRSAP